MVCRCLAMLGNQAAFVEEKQNFMRDYPNSSFVETLSSLDKNLKSDLAKKKLERSIQNKK